MIATDAYELCKHDAGVVERAGRSVIELEGAEAAEFLQGQVTNDVEALEPGQGCYAALLDHKGKLRTDMRVLRLAPDRLLVDAESIARRVLIHNFETYSLGRDVRTRDLTDSRAVFSLIGPASRARVGPGAPRARARLRRARAARLARDHRPRRGPHGARPSEAGDVRGLAERVDEDVAECLRIESGRPRLGHDMDSSTMPQEAGINERAVSFTKGCYVGQETVARLFYRGKPNRHLRGLRLAAPARTRRRHPPRREGGGQRRARRASPPASGPSRSRSCAARRRRATRWRVEGNSATIVELPFTNP